MSRKIMDRTGETVINSEEGAREKGWWKMEIAAYRSSTDMDVLIDGKYLLTGQSYGKFIRRNIKNPYHRSVYGIGHIGDGKYIASEKGIHAPHYNTWRHMIRCCSEAYQEKHPRYRGYTVSDEWRNYQVYAAWYDQNRYEIKGETITLNNNILFKGNKLFSKDTCILVPKKINSLLGNRGRPNGGLPKGVRLQANGKFLAYFNKKGISVSSTKEKAFRAYKTAKEDQIKETIDLYQGRIPEPHYTRLRNALFAYEVCIDD